MNPSVSVFPDCHFWKSRVWVDDWYSARSVAPSALPTCKLELPSPSSGVEVTKLKLCLPTCVGTSEIGCANLYFSVGSLFGCCEALASKAGCSMM